MVQKAVDMIRSRQEQMFKDYVKTRLSQWFRFYRQRQMFRTLFGLPNRALFRQAFHRWHDATHSDVEEPCPVEQPGTDLEDVLVCDVETTLTGEVQLHTSPPPVRRNTSACRCVKCHNKKSSVRASTSTSSALKFADSVRMSRRPFTTLNRQLSTIDSSTQSDGNVSITEVMKVVVTDTMCTFDDHFASRLYSMRQFEDEFEKRRNILRQKVKAAGSSAASAVVVSADGGPLSTHRSSISSSSSRRRFT